MPNNVHFLMHLLGRRTRGSVMGSLKGYTSRTLGPEHRWQRNYFDRAIRDKDRFQRPLEYIEWNPAKAKLVLNPEDFRWSSSHKEGRRWLMENSVD